MSPLECQVWIARALVEWMIPVALFGPFLGLLVQMWREDAESKKWEDKE